MHFMGEEEHTGGTPSRTTLLNKAGGHRDLPLPAHRAVCPAALDQAAASPPADGHWAPAAAAAAAAAFPASPQRSECCRGACWKTGAASCGRCFHNNQGTAISAVLQRDNFESYKMATLLAQRLESQCQGSWSEWEGESTCQPISEPLNQQNVVIKPGHNANITVLKWLLNKVLQTEMVPEGKLEHLRIKQEQ